MIEVKVPALGESITTARIAKLLVAAGSAVARDENICLLDTEKISLEVSAPEAGVLSAWQVKEGDDVAVGTVIATIDDKAKAGAGGGEKTPEAVAVSTATAPVNNAPIEPTPAPAKNEIPAKANPAPAPQAVAQPMAQPAVQLTPTYNMPPHVTDARGEERVKMSKLREAIARRLKGVQMTAAILTTFNEVDMALLIEMRQLHREKFQQQHGTKLGFMSFFIKAVCQGLKDFPIINASLDGNDIIYKNYYDIGIAVGSPTGLVVPVLRDADKKSFADIERDIADFGKRAEAGKLTMQDLSGGTFSITNGGIFGSMLSTPILNPPQSAILGMHKIEERAVVKNGMITIAPVMYLALSYDHRIIDGREAVSFLTMVKELLERPERLLLDI
ncbi:MAG: 2-oxoglutarate dehydrogenase complex dihydrolipoyllysine-residue succinyltransferase [Hydrotalea sp.]|nr:2-oxoglutarate dehydrogenase complex dihydrolipoyllysine-residue succinyltransferase [Hydrotalea sp.]